MSQRIQLPDPRIRVEGAVELDRSGTGITARRLPARYRHQFPMEVDFLASSPSGVRLRFVTNSSAISLEVLPTHLQLGDHAGSYWSRFDLTVDGVPVDQQTTTAGHLLVVDVAENVFDLRPGDATSVDFALTGSEHVYEIWLPTSSTVELRAVVIDDEADIAPGPPDGRPRWVHHGSSISHCLEANGPAFSWPATAARLGNLHLTNLALAGQCHLDQFVARTMRDLPADFLSLKCGINVANGDTLRLRTFPSALHGFLDTVRDGHPSTPFLVVSPIVCPALEDRAGPSDGSSGTTVALGTETTQRQGALTLRQIRALVEQVVTARQQAGDDKLFYLDGRVLFGGDDIGHLPDGLHPDGVGYVLMGERFAERVFGPGGVFAPGAEHNGGPRG